MNIVHVLARAVALGDQAAQVGFDWPDIRGVLDKVAEESSELREAIASGDLAHAEAELGDLLFVLASVGRHLGIDPERALDGANRRFSARFARMSEDITADGRSWDSLSLDEMEARWQQAKKSLL
ncbi:MAG: MazG nucleotide pyrophosphohydrolase domain-containing protein [Gammaproteobacteria bacterium]